MWSLCQEIWTLPAARYPTIYVHQGGLANAYYTLTSRICMHCNASGLGPNPAYSAIYTAKPSTARPGRVTFDPLPGTLKIFGL
jgi:hypothetical protein